MKGLEPLTPYMRIQKSDLSITASALKNRANANKNGGRRIDEDFAVLGVRSITEGVLG
jgi:hypothetical protein